MTPLATTQPKYELIGFRYDGSFPLDFLECDESVAATGTGSGNCVITSPRGHVRLRPGDFISRRQDGSLFTTSQDFGPRERGDRHTSPGVDADRPSPCPPNSGSGDGSRVSRISNDRSEQVAA